MRKFLMISAAALILTACSNADAEKVKADATKTVDAAHNTAKEAAAGSDKSYAKPRKFNATKLGAVLDALDGIQKSLSPI